MSPLRRGVVVPGMNRIDRLVAMVLYLQGRRVVRGAELARHFEVTARTIYRDMAALAEAGVPLVGEAGVGYSLMKGYHLPPVMFSAEEAAALFVGGELVKQFTDASLRAPMAAALEKLRAVLPRDRQDHVEKLIRHTLVQGRPVQPGAAAPADQRWLATVQQGVVGRRVLRMTYQGADRPEETRRDVEPLGVVFYGGNWHLVAWCRLRSDLRHFRIDRLRGLALLPETFAAREDFSLTEHMEACRKSEAVEPVRVWFHARAAERAHRESLATLVEETRRAGGAECSFFTASLEWTARWLLSFGGQAEALAPPKLRRLVRAEAQRIARRHRATRS